MRSLLVLRTLVAVALSVALGSLRAEPAELPAKDRFYLFLLVGQSNMAGRGVIEAEDQVPHPRVLMLNKANAWVPAVDPLHFDKTAAGVGLGRSFGLQMAEALPGVTIGLISCAVGGSPIDAWKPGEFYQPTKSHPWDDAIRRAKAALQVGTLKGILWHQGESDSNRELTPAYASKLHALVGRFRVELNGPDVPFLAGQMGHFADQPWNEFKMQVDRAHQELPRHVKRSAFVSSDALVHKGDKVHFDAASYREFGRRYAKAYLTLVQDERDSRK